jgi:hypothetical protein
MEIIVALFLWCLCGIVCIALDILTAGKTTTGAVVVQVLLGPIALVAFLVYLIVTLLVDYLTEASDNVKNNLLAVGVFTIIAAIASIIYRVWIL